MHQRIKFQHNRAMHSWVTEDLLAYFPRNGYFGKRWAFISVLGGQICIIVRMRGDCYFRASGQNSNTAVGFGDPDFSILGDWPNLAGLAIWRGECLQLGTMDEPTSVN